MIETDLGCVTAYADAVAQGYTGTREEFGQVLAILQILQHRLQQIEQR